MSELYQSLSHSKWDCKYHVVFVPKRRRKAIFGQTKHPVASVIGFPKGTSAIAIARLCGKERNFSGEHFWARGGRP
jgi:putative transposase